MRPAELGIMLVMVIMGTAPNTAGRQRVNPKNFHEQLGHPRAIENGVMLLVVVNDEQAQNQQSGQETADDFGGGMKIPKRPRERRPQEKRRREHMPPTLQR